MYKEAPDERTQKKNHNGKETCTSGDGSGETQYVERDQTAESGEDHIDGVGASTHQEIDVLGAVVDGVEAPEPGNFVGPTMPPIGTDVSDDERGDDPNPGGRCRNRRSESSGNRVVNEPSSYGLTHVKRP
jgi:hypothetical protein